MILITGAAGFIGSAYIRHLNDQGIKEIIACDSFGTGEKWQNLKRAKLLDFIRPEECSRFIQKYKSDIKWIIHMGACSATTETDMDFLHRNNVEFSKSL